MIDFTRLAGSYLKGRQQWRMNKSKQRVPACRAAKADIADLAAIVDRADTVQVADTAVRAAKADPAVVLAVHAAESANFSARRKFANSASRKWI